jgi:hypothetical protein
MTLTVLTRRAHDTLIAVLERFAPTGFSLFDPSDEQMQDVLNRIDQAVIETGGGVGRSGGHRVGLTVLPESSGRTQP